MDETCLDFNGCADEDYISALESVLDRLDDAIIAGYDCFYTDELFFRPVHGDSTLWELFNPQSPISIPPEVRVRLAVVFSKLSTIQDVDFGDAVVPPVKYERDGLDCSSSIAWACFVMLAGIDNIVACITSSLAVGDALLNITSGEGVVGLWFVASQKGDETLFRWIICNHTSSPAEMEAYASSAFRELDFVEGAFNGIKGMSKPYANVVDPIVRHLSALSDEGRRIFSGPRADVEAEFGPYGVDISDENGATKRNARAKADRTVLWDKKERLCWWHTKLERYQDRIHFCPADLVVGGKILVGIFCYHLL
jgi:hypothetical protein